MSLFVFNFSVLSLEESVKAMSLSAEEDDIPWDNMRDNRDLTVFTSWDPKERYGPDRDTGDHDFKSLSNRPSFLSQRVD